MDPTIAPPADVHGDDPLVALPEVDAPEVEAPPSGGSLLDHLRGRREEIARAAAEGENYIDLDIPGYNGRFFVRYVYPEGGWKRLRAISKAAEGSTDPLAELYVHAGILLACTQQVLGRDENGKEENPDPEGAVLGFDRRLAALLGIEIPDTIDKSVGRYVLRQVFSPEQARTGEYAGDVAVSAHAIRVSAYMETREGKAGDEFVGES